MQRELRSFRKLEGDLVQALVQRARARIKRGEKIHVLGVRRIGDDDGRLSFTVVVDPPINAAGLGYEPRADAGAKLWDCDEAPPAITKLVGRLRRAHGNEDADDFPGLAVSSPQALFTFMLACVAERLSIELSLPVKLMCTEGSPIYDLERGELRYWVEETG